MNDEESPPRDVVLPLLVSIDVLVIVEGPDLSIDS